METAKLKEKITNLFCIVSSNIKKILHPKNWIMTVLLFLFGVLLGLSVIYFALRGIGYIGNNYTLIFPRIIEIKINPPVIFVKKSDVDQTLYIDKEIERRLNSLSPTPTATPSAKPHSSIVKPVEATGGYTYSKYANRPHYGAVLAGLKARFTNWEDAAELESHEGMFQPEVINPISGACGLPQALPCSKLSSKCPIDETGIDCQLDWMKDYIADRYGTVSNALKFRLANNWY